MIEKARGAGLVFDEGVLQTHVIHPDPLAKLHNSKTGIYWPTPGLDRVIGKTSGTAESGKTAPSIDPTQSLHASVLARWDGDPEYRFKSLMNYFKLSGDARSAEFGKQ